MPFGNITSANTVFLLSIATVYPAPVQLAEFGVDDAFVAEIFDTAETQIGVDGYSAAGYRPHEVPMTIRLLASSSSVVVFENWWAAQDATTSLYQASAIIQMPSIRRQYSCAGGVLQRASAMAEVRRVLTNREFRITWLPQGPGVPAISPGPM